MAMLPPFPEDVPTAPIASISFSKLQSENETEASKVLEACTTHGFFYLDMRDCPEGQDMVQQASSLITVASGFFSQPLEMKRKYAVEKGVSMAGYKEAGSVKATDGDKRPDSTEFLNIFKDHMHNITDSRDYPDEVKQAKPTIQAFIQNAHTCGMIVLDTLARGLHIPPSEFTGRHKFTSPAEDQMRLTRTLPRPQTGRGIGLASHTDFGSVTILFNWLGGLQIQSRDPARNGEWDYVKPLPGHAIINLGDAMVVLTNGKLKSAKHRVIPAPGEQAKIERYSLVYFVRPVNSVLMKPIESINSKEKRVRVGGKLLVQEDKVYTAAEWMVKRAEQMGGFNADTVLDNGEGIPKSRI